jgi:hypothetical protein
MKVEIKSIIAENIIAISVGGITGIDKQDRQNLTVI